MYEAKSNRVEQASHKHNDDGDDKKYSSDGEGWKKIPGSIWKNQLKPLRHHIILSMKPPLEKEGRLSPSKPAHLQ